MIRILAWTLSLAAAAPGLAGPPLRPLLDSIRQVETGGHPKGGTDAVGDDGRSVGPYQIQWRYWKDSGIPGRYEYVRNAAYAERVMIAYWRRYCPEAIAAGDWQRLARVHNGGPFGWSNPKTLYYWHKVRRELAKRDAFR